MGNLRAVSEGLSYAPQTTGSIAVNGNLTHWLMAFAAISCLCVPKTQHLGKTAEMKRLLVVAIMFWVVLVQGASAQSANDVVWVQIEARPTIAEATDRARSYAAALPDVSGFALGTGWYGIALGPYTRSDAEQVLRVYREEGLIPSDSFIADRLSFSTPFWPSDSAASAQSTTQPLADIATTPDTPAITTITPEPGAPDETVAQARQNEQFLDEDGRKELQIALQWAGYYNSTIDGAFGSGTRNSMANWQSANGFDPTGVLTTLQREELLGQFNAVFDGLGMAVVSDERAGIEIMLPTSLVGFEKYQAPFAHYAPSGDMNVRVLLISQAGDQKTLFGLYDIMQTLEIVPLDGPRQRDQESFVLIGQNADFISETRVRLYGGQIKGFTLLWPRGDDNRRGRVMDRMESSFRSLNAVLDSAAGSETQSIDLISGLQIRKPRLSRSGFYVDQTGSVVTTSEAVQSCSRITLDEEYEAVLTSQDDAVGIAVLKPVARLSPPGIAGLAAAPPRLLSDVAVSGYSFGGTLNAPSMTFGTLSDIKGLRGEDQLSRLSLEHLPGDAGGPVMDARGNVLGMLLPRPQGDQQLPPDVSFALNSTTLAEALRRMGVQTKAGTALGDLSVIDMTRRGLDMTVLVSCWE